MNIKTIKEIIAEEKSLYIPEKYRFNKYIHQKRYMIWRCLSAFRLSQFYKKAMQDKKVGKISNIYYRILYRYYQRKKNIFGEKTGIEIANHCKLGRRLSIWHGGVVISANLGDDCIIHGNNVLGNKGGNEAFEIPTLGNCVDVGVGAVLIGKIYIADGCVIGANAVVNKSFAEKGKILVGIPAKELTEN